MTEHQPGTVLPLSECKPGWLVDLGENLSDILAEDRIFRVHGAPTISAKVTLISALPGWRSIHDGDPERCGRIQLCEHGGTIITIEGRDVDRACGAVFWRDASADAPAQAPDLAARLAELERRFDAHTHRYFDGQSIVATDGPSYESAPEPAPDATSRKPELGDERDELVAQMKDDFLAALPDPAPGVMTDDEIVAAVRYSAGFSVRYKGDSSENRMIREAIRLTRASIRAQLAANEGKVARAICEAMNPGCDQDEVQHGGHPEEGTWPFWAEYTSAAEAALKAHKEGV